MIDKATGQETTFPFRSYGYYYASCWCGQEFRAFGLGMEAAEEAAQAHYRTCPMAQAEIAKRRLTERSPLPDGTI